MPTAQALLSFALILVLVSTVRSDLCDGTLVTRTNTNPIRFEAVRISNGAAQSVVTLSPPQSCGDVFTIDDTTFCCLNSSASTIACADLNGDPIWWDSWSLAQLDGLSEVSNIEFDTSSRIIALYKNRDSVLAWGTLEVGQSTWSDQRTSNPLSASTITVSTFNRTMEPKNSSFIAISTNRKAIATDLEGGYRGTVTSCSGADTLSVGTHLAVSDQSIWSINTTSGRAYAYPQSIFGSTSCSSSRAALVLPFGLSSVGSTGSSCSNIIAALDPSRTYAAFSGLASPNTNLLSSNGVAQVQCNNSYCYGEVFYNESVRAMAWTQSTALKLAHVSDTPCPQPSPGSAFTCANGLWISRGSVNTTEISVTGSVVVSGNFSVSTSTTINGLQASLNITDCASISGSIILVLSEGDLAQIKGSGSLKGSTQSVIITTGECPNGLGFSGVDASGLVKNKKCAKVKVTLSQSSPQTLSALIQVDTTPCNLWWIILLSVIAAAILIAVIVLALLFTFHESCRYKVRPFSKPRAA